MKKCYISILSGILAGLFLLSACDNPLAESSAQKPASSESSGALIARIFLPDYHKLAAQQSRVIAPQTAKVRLSIGSGTSTIIWTQHGDDLLIDWNDLESVAGAPANLPGGIWTAQFLALESGVYAPGTLKVELLDADDQALTRGYNAEAVVIIANASTNTPFFTTPVALESNAGSLEDGEMRFWRVYQKTASSTVTLTAADLWPDIVLFNNNGTFLSYHSISGTGDSSVSLPAESPAYYYIGVWADAGAVTSYNLTFAGDLAYTISSIAGVQAYLSAASSGATAADPVPLDVQLDLADTSNGWAALLDAIQNAGKFVALNLSACTLSGTEYDPGTANTGESKIVSLVLPNGARSIKAGTSFSNATFKNFTALASVSGSAVEIIGSYAFYDCAALTTVNLPAASSIGSRAFSDCTALTTVNLPAASSIGYYAFSRCTGLTSVNLPEASSIGNGAFSHCTGLTTISLPATLTTIGANPFADCINLATITVASDNPNYSVQGSMLLNKAGTTLIAYPSATGVVTLNTVSSIGSSAFDGCTALTSVSFPAASSIGEYAFSGCDALTSVSLPEATDIGRDAFWGCDALTEVSLPKASSIGLYAFGNCDALTTVNLPAATFIDDWAFYGTGTSALTITLGSTAPTLGEDMFYRVDSAKTVIVKVPSGATGYGTLPATYSGADSAVNWGNGFRGMGWDGSAFLSNGSINSNITLTIQVE